MLKKKFGKFIRYLGEMMNNLLMQTMIRTNNIWQMHLKHRNLGLWKITCGNEEHYILPSCHWTWRVFDLILATQLVNISFTDFRAELIQKVHGIHPIPNLSHLAPSLIYTSISRPMRTILQLLCNSFLSSMWDKKKRKRRKY